MAAIVKINGKTYHLESATIIYRRAGRHRRAWHKYVRGLVDGLVMTICLHVARMADVLKNVGASILNATSTIDDAMSRQRILIDAALWGKG